MCLLRETWGGCQHVCVKYSASLASILFSWLRQAHKNPCNASFLSLENLTQYFLNWAFHSPNASGSLPKQRTGTGGLGVSPWLHCITVNTSHASRICFSWPWLTTAGAVQMVRKLLLSAIAAVLWITTLSALNQCKQSVMHFQRADRSRQRISPVGNQNVGRGCAYFGG